MGKAKMLVLLPTETPVPCPLAPSTRNKSSLLAIMFNKLPWVGLCLAFPPKTGCSFLCLMSEAPGTLSVEGVWWRVRISTGVWMNQILLSKKIIYENFKDYLIFDSFKKVQDKI